MARSWTYAQTRIHTGDTSPHDLTVLLDGQPVGRVTFVSLQGASCWQWRVTMTQAYGTAETRDGALNALRDSLTADMDDPF